jgi:hypothetical protein
MKLTATNVKKMTQYQKNVKKFGEPKFKDGDLVKTSLTGIEILIVNGAATSNGFCWMYSFRGKEMSCAQHYIYPAASEPPPKQGTITWFEVDKELPPKENKIPTLVYAHMRPIIEATYSHSQSKWFLEASADWQPTHWAFISTPKTK